MDISESNAVGVGFFVLISILSAYYLILKIRRHHSEIRNPDFNYITQGHLEKVRCEIMRSLSEATHDLRTLRSEIREDSRNMQRQHTKSLVEMRELIGKNAQDISALAAQMQNASQRIIELSIKTDKLRLQH